MSTLRQRIEDRDFLRRLTEACRRYGNPVEPATVVLERDPPRPARPARHKTPSPDAEPTSGEDPCPS